MSTNFLVRLYVFLSFTAALSEITSARVKKQFLIKSRKNSANYLEKSHNENLI